MSKKGNLMSEQINNFGDTILDHDQPVRGYKKINDILKEFLGDSVFTKKIDNKNVQVFKTDGRKKDIILLCKAVTYMGGNGKKTKHPPYLKRIQIPKEWKIFVNKNSHKYDIRFLGIYHYNGLYIFTDVIKESYMTREVNNSSAHIYINDLIQAFNNDFFKRIDYRNNTLVSVSGSFLSKYLNGKDVEESDTIKLIRDFNYSIFTNEWEVAIDQIKIMYNDNFNHWKETEWPGWRLEHRFSNFLKKHSKSVIDYRTDNNKLKFPLDFDVWLNIENHYADLKSSSSNQKEVPGNDYQSVKEAIKLYGAIWYVVYEHETIPDKLNDYEQTKKRAFYIRDNNEWDKYKPFNELSYKDRMKHSIKYTNMFILELNANNFNHYTNLFKQGKQQDGSPRSPKIKFSKRQIENAIIFKQSL